MRKSYDFSNGERGKFYHQDAKLNIPVDVAGPAGPDYLAVRKALAGLKGSLSDDIIKARDDRV